MTTTESMLVVALVSLSIAMVIMAMQVRRHERYFDDLSKVITAIGMKIMLIERKQERENVDV